ncbi:MAG TPA: hypothetical protein VFY16_12985 [Gemmatimonadaceae bacterium]|nr:hypothetical protein [Gemmatimonadaceae bacterium]
MTLTDTQLRFLRDAAQRVPLDRVHEAYVFAPMRQGGVETGVAVIVVSLAPAAAEPGEAPAPEVPAPDAEPHAVAPLAGDEPVGSEEEHVKDAVAQVMADADVTAAPLDEVPASVEEAAAELAELLEAEPRAEAEPEPVTEEPPVRHTVYTARYRLQLKGPERGRWEVDVVEEADAPLVTVDAVVRGVQHRAGDEHEVERLTADVFLAVAQGATIWPTAP